MAMTDSGKAEKENAWSAKRQCMLEGLLSGAFAFAVVYLLVSRLGMNAPGRPVFAVLVALLVGGVVCRERTLVRRLRAVEYARGREEDRNARRLEYLYTDSTASLVVFDAGSLLIERASPGFVSALKLEPRGNPAGVALPGLLGVEDSVVERIVNRIQRGETSLREAVDARLEDGESAKFLVSGHCINGTERIEATFLHVPWSSGEIRELERTVGDLERFRRGMVRREKRILELKGEVNSLLRRSGERARYQVDDQSDDSEFEQNHRSETDGPSHG